MGLIARWNITIYPLKKQKNIGKITDWHHTGTGTT
jgi:hypothetical protein